MNYLIIATIMLLNIIFCEASEISNKSIQGKSYSNRTNGIYDKTITDEQIENFLTKLKLNLKADNSNKLADMFQYPFNCNSCKKPKIIKSRTQFKNRYKEIFTKKIREAVSNASLDELFVNYQGFMIGNGEIWFDPKKGIKAIN